MALLSVGCSSGHRRVSVAPRPPIDNAVSRSLRHTFEAALRDHRGLSDYDRDDNHHTRDEDDDDTIGPKDRDGDRDSTSNSYLDRDENSEEPGLPGPPAAARAVAALVHRYFKAAVDGDGPALCALMVPQVAHGIASDVGSLPPYAQGKACASVMSKLTGYNHAQLAFEAAALEGIHPRLTKDHGWALLAFHGISTRQLTVERQGGAWKLVSAVDQAIF